MRTRRTSTRPAEVSATLLSQRIATGLLQNAPRDSTPIVVLGQPQVVLLSLPYLIVVIRM